MSDRPTLGIIGGSGLYGLPSLANAETIAVETPFGRPSDPIRVGTIAGRRVAFLSRHGTGHRLSPSEVPYAANVFAMKSLGVERLISVSAVGSLREELPPRSFVVPDQLIDRTIGRRRTFFDCGVVAHVSLADPFCPQLFADVAAHADQGGLPVHHGGTYICIEGPQFSTRAESAMFRAWGASIIGMTAMPEARLAREAQLCYACLAMVTDYDVWHEHEGPVSVEGVVANLHAMTDAVQRIVTALADATFNECGSGCATALASAVVTSSDAMSDEARVRLSLLTQSYAVTENTG